jgi:CheY-like chemotaxis protein
MFSIEDPVLDSFSSGLVRRKFCLFGFNEHESTRLACQFAEWKCLSRGVDALDIPVEAIDCYDLLIVNGDKVNGEALSRTEAWWRIRKPVIFIGSSGESWAKDDRCGFLLRPWKFQDLLRLTHNMICRADEKGLGARVSEARILIADDDPKVTSLLQAVFRNLRMECHSARTGREALSMIRNTLPDLVYLDINMSGMNGFDVLSAVRRDPGTASTLVTLLTERREERDILRASELQADGYVMKPFSTLEVSARTKKLLRRDLS